MKALICNGIVQQLSETEFPVSPSMTWIDIPDDLTIKFGYIYDNGTFTEPPTPEPPPPTELEILKGQVADLLMFAAGDMTKEDLTKKYSDVLIEVKL